MLHQRNVEGLRENAQKKRQEAIERTEQGIRQLLKEGRSINFKTVASVSNVSTAWLYKEPEIKARIEHLREQGIRKKSVPPQQKATDASKDAKYQALKKRLQEVEAENRGLRDHLEAIHGRQRVLASENEAQRRELERRTLLLEGYIAEIEALKQSSNTYEQSDDGQEVSQRQVETGSSKSRVTPIHSRSRIAGITEKVQAELNGLNIQMNSTLARTIRNSESEQKTLLAIESFVEAQKKGKVLNSVGYLVTAIKEGWIPSEGYEQKVELDAFSEWYQLARSLGLVEAATQFDGVQHVCTTNGEWIPFKQMTADYPLKKLQGMD